MQKSGTCPVKAQNVESVKSNQKSRNSVKAKKMEKVHLKTKSWKGSCQSKEVERAQSSKKKKKHGKDPVNAKKQQLRSAPIKAKNMERVQSKQK